MRFTLTLLLSLVLGLPNAGAATDYAHLEKKAKLFFDNAEWASANAMYLLMLEQRPTETSTYAKAAVVNIMAGDTLQALEMIPRSMQYDVPLDSLLHDVRTISFSIGRGDLYENYLLKIKSDFSWFSRVADNYLMRYYAFRRNGPELIKYAETMLKGLPDNVVFLDMLATGKMLSGETEQAVEIWERTVALYPDDDTAVLNLANCYDSLRNAPMALKWLTEAYRLKPTPYLASRIDYYRKMMQ